MRSLKQYIIEAASFKYYYHVTFTSSVKNIRRQGIKPLQTSNWTKGSGDRYNEYAGVYAFEHPEDAWKWAFRMNWDFKKPISIIRVKKSKTWKKDPAEDITLQMGKGKALMSQAAVPASHIVDSFDTKDFGTPVEQGISQKEWIDQIVDKLK